MRQDRNVSYAAAASSGIVDLNSDCAVFFPRQRAFQTASVDGNGKTFLNGFDAVYGRDLGVGLPQTGHVVQDFGSQLVPTLGPSPIR